MCKRVCILSTFQVSCNCTHALYILHDEHRKSRMCDLTDEGTAIRK